EGSVPASLARARRGLRRDEARGLRRTRRRGTADARARTRHPARHRQPAMTWTSFGLILSGVLLNASAQLFLKAGTNRLGIVSFTAADWFGQALRVSTNPFILGGLV